MNLLHQQETAGLRLREGQAAHVNQVGGDPEWAVRPLQLPGFTSTALFMHQACEFSCFPQESSNTERQPMGSQTVDRCPQSLPHLGESVQVLVAEAVFSLCPVVPEWKLSMGSVRVEHPHVLGGKQFNKMTRLQELFLTIQDRRSLFRNMH